MTIGELEPLRGVGGYIPPSDFYAMLVEIAIDLKRLLEHEMGGPKPFADIVRYRQGRV